MNKYFSGRRILGASIIAISLLAACNNESKKPNSGNSNNTASGGKIAYINVDTLQEKYSYWKKEVDALTTEQANVESELQRSAQQLQNDYAAFQQKAQSGQLTDEQGRAAQQRLAQMQQSLETRKATLSEQLQKRQMAFSEQLQKNIDDYLAIFNKDGKYDFIFSYSRTGQILYANKALDITDEVLKGLNEQKVNTIDTTKTK